MGGISTFRAVRILAVAFALAASAVGIVPAPAAASDAGRLLQLINGARSAAGIGTVSADGSLDALAQEHAERMAAEGRVFHNSALPDAAGPWKACGENVGRGSSVDAVHTGFMQDPTHRAVILNPVYQLVGIGVAPSSTGLMVVEVFLTRPGGASSPTAPRRVAPAPAPRRQPAPPPPEEQAPPEPEEPPPPQPIFDPHLRWDEEDPAGLGGVASAPRSMVSLASSVQAERLLLAGRGGPAAPAIVPAWVDRVLAPR